MPDQGRGRSRFSKALPAIPPIDTSVAQQETRPVPRLIPSNVSSSALISNAVPSLGDLPPPPPPPRNDDPRVPIQYTPLPPLPPSKQAIEKTSVTPAAATSGSQKMKIPRRPVGGNNKVDTTKPQAQIQAETIPTSTPTSTPVSSSQIPPSATRNRQQEPPPQLPSFRTSVFTIEQTPPEPPVKAAKRQVPSRQGQTQDQEQPMKKEPERELKRAAESSLQKEQPLSSIHMQSQLFPKPPSSAAAAATTTSAANWDMKTFQKPLGPQEPPEPSPQTLEYLQPSELAQPLKSPSYSLSSILSAYSRSSTESIIRSSDGTYSTRDSHAQESPNPQVSSSTTGVNSHYHEPSTSVSTITPITAVPLSQSHQPRPIANGHNITPSPPAPTPPSKDYVSPRPSSPPTHRVPAHAGSGTSSPPNEQIWRRRSFKGSRELPNLHLDYSHGSTAYTASAGTTQSQTTVVPAQTQDQPASIQETAAPLPPPKEVRGLPGRNIRPAQQRKESVDDPTMGHGGSKLQQLKDRFHRSRKSDDKTASKPTSPGTENGPPSSRTTTNQPPTPEYQKEDIRTSHVDKIASPASPASSPEPKVGLPRQPQQNSSQASIAPSAPAKSDSVSVNRKRVPGSSSVAFESIPGNDGSSDLRSAILSTTSPAAGRFAPVSSIHPAKSLPDLKIRGTPTLITEPFPPLSAFPSSGRNSPAPDGPHTRGRQFDGPGRPPASRESSARPDSRRGPDPIRNTGPDGSRFVRSSTGELCYKGRDGTLYPDMKESAQSPDPRAMRFPKAGGEPIPEGTILPAAPLKPSHHLCFHKHRAMQRQRNRRHPLACQTCQKADMEDRWACSFCSLRLCESCLGIFEFNKKDLTGLMSELAGKKTLSLSSAVRPGSSLGLSTVS